MHICKSVHLRRVYITLRRCTLQPILHSRCGKVSLITNGFSHTHILSYGQHPANMHTLFACRCVKQRFQHIGILVKYI